LPKYSESYLIYFELNDRTLRSGMNVFKLKGCSLLHHKLALTVLRLVTLLITVGTPFSQWSSTRVYKCLSCTLCSI